jgi:hypothetical protein
MSRVLTEIVEHATQLDLKVGGVAMMRFDADGVSRPNGCDKAWFTDLIGVNLALGGSGALAQALLTISGARIFNAWELINHASNNPYLAVQFWLPPDYDGSALKISLYLVKTATATGSNIVTRVALECIGSGDTLAASVAQTAMVTTAVGANNCLFVAEQTVTPDNAADGGLCHGYFQRRPTETADDYTGSVYLLGARVEYA